MTLLRTTMILAGLVVLAGCATPLEQCLYAAERDQREISRELDERRGNLQRGFRIERVLTPVMASGFCVNAEGVLEPCMRWEHETRETHHRINPELEAERIALLERQLAREDGRVAQASASCRATYPAE
ncbi:hypothetical protein [Pararhodobacter oceanensis]|uniref:hypothetical protein n=1 Tax=Pararhodobacter oceanensis TaxID=2172121 RepID=UPI003A95A4C0